MAYRQTPGRGPTAAFKNVTALLGPTVTEGGEVDPDTGVKTKTKTNKKGETITITKTKDASGRKTKTTNIKGPVETTTTPAPKPVTVTFNTPETASSSITLPKQTITPGKTTEGDTKPYVKPIKKDSYKEAYEKTDKSIPYPDFKEKAIKWNKENPGKTTAPKLDIIKAKPVKIVNPGTSSTFTIQGLPTKNTSTYSSTKTKVKDPKKINLPKLDINLPKLDFTLPKRKPKNTESCTPGSTSVECVGGGSAGGNLLTTGGKGAKGLQSKQTIKNKKKDKKELRKITTKEFVGFDNLGRHIKGKVADIKTKASARKGKRKNNKKKSKLKRNWSR